jgi:hypothetical protein
VLPALTLVGKRAPDALAGAALAILALVAAWTFRDYGLGWDDLTHSQYGQLLLDFYGSGFSDTRALSFVNLYMYGGGFDMAAALIAKLLPFDLFETRRLFGAAVGIVGIAVTWRIARKLGGPLAGLAALLLLATCPLYYGHIYINPKDAPFAVAVVFLIACMMRAVTEYPRPTFTTAAVLGVGLGIAVGSRILGVMAAMYMLPPALFLLAQQARAIGWRQAIPDFGRFVVRLLPALVVAYPIMGLLWPWSVLEPLNLFRAVDYFSHFFEKPWKEMFEGALISVPEMPRSYVPVLFFLKFPADFLALGAAGLAGILAAVTRTQIPVRYRANLLLVLTAASLPILIAVLTRPAMYNGIRHFIFVVPPMAIAGGLAAVRIIRTLGRFSRAAGAAAVAAILFGMALTVDTMVRIHPYQYTYFNRMFGGIYAADARFMLDYWGLAFKQASLRLREVLAARREAPATQRRWRIAVCGPHAPAEVELGEDFVLTWDPKGADFAMMLGEFYCAELNAPLLVEVKREGVVFARVYDIRGLTIDNLFTIPPVTR